MRPVERGKPPIDPVTKTRISFKKYQDSKKYLIEVVGSYCCYCEKALTQVVDVEHILPKNHYPQLEIIWHNFLISCKVCNSIKSSGKIRRKDFYWADVDNTFRMFEFDPNSQDIRINASLSAMEQKIAKNTLDLVGLNRRPGHPEYRSNSADKRWRERFVVLKVAQEAFQDLQQSDTPEMRNQIVRNAEARGFWSIWMIVFQTDADMLNRLINAFPGTCKNCFDVLGKAIPRPKGRI